MVYCIHRAQRGEEKMKKYKVALEICDIMTITYTVIAFHLRMAILIAKARAYVRFGKLKFSKVYAEEVKDCE